MFFWALGIQKVQRLSANRYNDQATTGAFELNNKASEPRYGRKQGEFPRSDTEDELKCKSLTSNFAKLMRYLAQPQADLRKPMTAYSNKSFYQIRVDGLSDVYSRVVHVA